jgi:hypothetical protein
MSFAVPEYRYVVANNRVLLVGTSRIVVGVFADATPDERRTLGALRFTRSA